MTSADMNASNFAPSGTSTSPSRYRWGWRSSRVPRLSGGYGAGKPVAAQGEVGMASSTTIVLEDDLEGGPASQTIRFSLGAREYEIDLNTENASRFRSQMA